MKRKAQFTAEEVQDRPKRRVLAPAASSSKSSAVSGLPEVVKVVSVNKRSVSKRTKEQSADGCPSGRSLVSLVADSGDATTSSSSVGTEPSDSYRHPYSGDVDEDGSCIVTDTHSDSASRESRPMAFAMPTSMSLPMPTVSSSFQSDSNWSTVATKASSPADLTSVSKEEEDDEFGDLFALTQGIAGAGHSSAKDPLEMSFDTLLYKLASLDVSALPQQSGTAPPKAARRLLVAGCKERQPKAVAFGGEGIDDMSSAMRMADELLGEGQQVEGGHSAVGSGMLTQSSAMEVVAKESAESQLAEGISEETCPVCKQKVLSHRYGKHVQTCVGTIPADERKAIKMQIDDDEEYCRTLLRTDCDDPSEKWAADYWVECPVCWERLSIGDNINHHVNSCLDQSERQQAFAQKKEERETLDAVSGFHSMSMSVDRDPAADDGDDDGADDMLHSKKSMSSGLGMDEDRRPHLEQVAEAKESVGSSSIRPLNGRQMVACANALLNEQKGTKQFDDMLSMFETLGFNPTRMQRVVTTAAKYSAKHKSASSLERPFGADGVLGATTARSPASTPGTGTSARARMPLPVALTRSSQKPMTTTTTMCSSSISSDWTKSGKLKKKKTSSIRSAHLTEPAPCRTRRRRRYNAGETISEDVELPDIGSGAAFALDFDEAIEEEFDGDDEAEAVSIALPPAVVRSDRSGRIAATLRSFGVPLAGGRLLFASGSSALNDDVTANDDEFEVMSTVAHRGSPPPPVFEASSSVDSTHVASDGNDNDIDGMHRFDDGLLVDGLLSARSSVRLPIDSRSRIRYSRRVPASASALTASFGKSGSSGGVGVGGGLPMSSSSSAPKLRSASPPLSGSAPPPATDCHSYRKGKSGTRKSTSKSPPSDPTRRRRKRHGYRTDALANGSVDACMGKSDDSIDFNNLPLPSDDDL